VPVAVLGHPYGRLLWGGAIILLAFVLGYAVRWIGRRLDARHPDEERELVRLRRAETILILLGPIVYTIDEEAMSRYQRRVLVR
jgi:hypothetical protein